MVILRTLLFLLFVGSSKGQTDIPRREDIQRLPNVIEEQQLTPVTAEPMDLDMNPDEIAQEVAAGLIRPSIEADCDSAADIAMDIERVEQAQELAEGLQRHAEIYQCPMQLTTGKTLDTSHLSYRIYSSHLSFGNSWPITRLRRHTVTDNRHC